MNKEIVKLPKGALRLVESGEHGGCVYAAKTEDSKPRLNMTAYSGRVIKGHWYWGDLVVSLEGVKMAASKIPVLEEHDINKRIGFTTRLLVSNENGIQVDPEKTKFLNNETARDFIESSQDGFPYQSSMYVKPSKIKRLDEKEEIEVNGFSFKGPGTVFVQSEIKEVSACVFGWDSKTQSSAFSRTVEEEVELSVEGGDAEIETVAETYINDETLGEEVTQEMDLKELKAKHPELVQQIADEAVGKAEEKFSSATKEWETKFVKMEERVETLSDQLAQADKEITLSREEANHQKAEALYASMLGESNIPDRFYEKVKNVVRYEKFVNKDDNKFDENAFTEALDAEIKDWESRGVTNEVLGMSTTVKNDSDEGESAKKLAEENKTAVDDLLARVGQ